MRPNGVESIRGIQVALTEVLSPEIQFEFTRNVLQTIQMLLESLAGEWDTAAEDLHNDNRKLADLLSLSAQTIRALPQRNDQLTSIVDEVEDVASGEEQQSLVVSTMTERNNQLRATLERVLVAFEDVIDDAGYSTLVPIRRTMYQHLREVAVRGWSFWDAASFRERMARERSA